MHDYVENSATILCEKVGFKNLTYEQKCRYFRESIERYEEMESNCDDIHRRLALRAEVENIKRDYWLFTEEKHKQEEKERKERRRLDGIVDGLIYFD